MPDSLHSFFHWLWIPCLRCALSRDSKGQNECASDPTPRCWAGRRIPAGGTNKWKRASGRDQPDMHGAVSKALSDLRGVFGQDLVFLMPRHTFFPTQVRATCATCAKVVYTRGHCSCRSAVHTLCRMSLSMAYLQALRFDGIWHITVRADPL